MRRMERERGLRLGLGRRLGKGRREVRWLTERVASGGLLEPEGRWEVREDDHRTKAKEGWMEGWMEGWTEGWGDGERHSNREERVGEVERRSLR